MKTTDLGTGYVGLLNGISLSEHIKSLELTPEKRSRIVYKPLPSDDPIKRHPGITAAHENLGWEPKVGLDECLRMTTDYFRAVP